MKRHIVCFGRLQHPRLLCRPRRLPRAALLRFNEEERWTCLLQKALGEDYLVVEEGLTGRTTVFEDPLCHGEFRAPARLPLSPA